MIYHESFSQGRTKRHFLASEVYYCVEREKGSVHWHFNLEIGHQTVHAKAV